MVMAIPPRTYKCKVCSWKHSVSYTSDALAEPFNHFTSCPECRGAVEQGPPSLLDSLALSVKEKFGKRRF